MESMRQPPPVHIDAFVRQRNGDVINSTIAVAKSVHEPTTLGSLGQAVLAAGRAGGSGPDATLAGRDLVVHIDGQHVLVHVSQTGAEVTFDWPAAIDPSTLNEMAACTKNASEETRR